MSRRLCLLLFALTVVLAGCRVDIQTDVAVREDGSGSVVVTVTADREVVAAAPTLASDLTLDDVTAAGWTVDGPSQTADGGLQVTLTKMFRSPEEARLVLAELSGSRGPFQSLVLVQRRSFADVTSTFSGTASVTGGLEAFGDSDLVTALGGAQPYASAVGGRPLEEVLGIRLAVAMPGEVTEAGPTAAVADDGSTATYQVPLDGTSIDLGTTAELRDEDALAARRRQRLAIGGLVLWLAVLAGLGTWWWLRRRQAPPRPGPGGGPSQPDDPEHPRPPARAAQPPVRTPRPPAPVPAGPPARPIDPGLAPPRPIDPGLVRPIDPGLAPPKRPAPGER